MHAHEETTVKTGWSEFGLSHKGKIPQRYMNEEIKSLSIILGTVVLTATIPSKSDNFDQMCHVSYSKIGSFVSMVVCMAVLPTCLSGLKYQHHNTSVMTLVHKVCGLSFSAVFELALKKASLWCLPENRGDRQSLASYLVPTKKKKKRLIFIVFL